MQLWAVLFINNCKNTTCFRRFLRPSSGVLKTVVTATGVCHESGWCISSEDVHVRLSTTLCHSRISCISLVLYILQTYDAWKLKYKTAHCLSKVSGMETMRKVLMANRQLSSWQLKYWDTSSVRHTNMAVRTVLLACQIYVKRKVQNIKQMGSRCKQLFWTSRDKLQATLLSLVWGWTNDRDINAAGKKKTNEGTYIE